MMSFSDFVNLPENRVGCGVPDGVNVDLEPFFASGEWELFRLGRGGIAVKVSGDEAEAHICSDVRGAAALNHARSVIAELRGRGVACVCVRVPAENLPCRVFCRALGFAGTGENLTLDIAEKH